MSNENKNKANTLVKPESKEAQKKIEVKAQQAELLNHPLFKKVGGIPPQIILPKTNNKRGEKNFDKPMVKWVFAPFNNAGREDGLRLYRWQKENELGSVYPYSLLGKKREIIKYSDEEYPQLQDLDPTWTREETDFLFDLCERYELRFIVIADRFSTESYFRRSMEEIKDRYFSIARHLLELRGDTTHQYVRKPFNFTYEVRRKANLEKYFLRSPEHQKMEKDLLDIVKAYDKTIQTEEKEQDNLKRLMLGDQFVTEPDNNTYENLQHPNFHDKLQNLPQVNGILSQKVGETSPLSPKRKHSQTDSVSGVFLRSQQLSAPLPISKGLQQKVDLILKEMGIQEKLPPTANVVRAFDQVRKEILIYLGLEKHLSKKEKEKKNIEQKIEEFNKIKKTLPPSGQPGMMMYPSGSGRIPPSAEDVLPQNYNSPAMRGHIPQMPHSSIMRTPLNNRGFPMMSPPSHMVPTMRPQSLDMDKTGEASLRGAPISHRPANPPPAISTTSVVPPEPAANRSERAVSSEPSKPEGKSEEKKKSKRKPRSEKKSKRKNAEGGHEAVSSDKKKKKY